MTKLRILAAIVALGAAAPAFAAEIDSTPNQAHLIVQQGGQTARMIEGRNSDRAPVVVDYSNLSNGSNR